MVKLRGLMAFHRSSKKLPKVEIVLGESQFGFRPNRGTIDAVVHPQFH